MALRGRRINNFIRLWCLVASGGLHICVSSTSFQKNDMSWPQQPLTEKVQKFNMTFHDSTQKFFFQFEINAKMVISKNQWRSTGGEAVEASSCQLFENWLMKQKSAILLKPLGTLI